MYVRVYGFTFVYMCVCASVCMLWGRAAGWVAGAGGLQLAEAQERLGLAAQPTAYLVSKLREEEAGRALASRPHLAALLIRHLLRYAILWLSRPLPLPLPCLPPDPFSLLVDAFHWS